MKYFNYFKTKLIASAVICFYTLGFINAQNAKIQLLHNSADTSLAIVDVYWNNAKFNNVTFRSASPVMDADTNMAVLTICDSSSSDSGNMVIAKFNIKLSYLSNNIAMIAGLRDTTLYAANPNGINRMLNVYIKTVSNTAISKEMCNVSFANGVTDMPGMDMQMRSGNNIYSNLKYGNLLTNNLLAAKNISVDIMASGTSKVSKTYYLPLSLASGKNIFMFSSGFLTPSNNNNGANAGLYAIDSNGGNATQLLDGAYMQFIHNSPDSAVGNVDIYINGNKATSLGFRKATGLVGMPVGNISIDIKKSNNNQMLYNMPTTTTAGSMSVAMIYGLLDTVYTKAIISRVDTINKVPTRVVINTSTYDRNPDGKDRSFKLSIKELRTLSTLQSPDPIGQPDTYKNNQMMLFQGVAGLNAVDIRGEGEGLYLGRNVMYSDFTEYVNSKADASTKYIFTKNNNTAISLGEFTANFTGIKYKAGIIFTSGFSRVADTIYIKRSLIQTNDIDSMLYNGYNKYGVSAMVFIAWPNGRIDTLKTEKKFVSGIKNTNSTIDVMVYPNPAKDKLNMVFDNSRNEVVNIKLYNLQGKEFMVDYSSSDLQQGKAELNLQQLNTGMYFLNIQIGDKLAVKKIIVE